MPEATMPAKKRSAPERAQAQTMPFPGESPTVSLALAAGRMYGMQPEDEKPTKRRSPATKKKPAKRSAKTKRPSKGSSKPRSRAR